MTLNEPAPERPASEPREPTTGFPPVQGAPFVPYATPIILPPARRPRVWTVFLVCVLTLIGAALVGGIVLVGIALVQAGPNGFGKAPDKAIMETMSTPIGLLSSMASTMLLLALAALSAAGLSPVPWRERLRLRPPEISGATWAASLFGMLGLNVAFTAAMNLGLSPEETILQTLSEAIASLSGLGLIPGFLVICVAPGIAEELLFRGYVQTRFAQRWRPGTAVFWTAMMFGLYHMDLTQGLFAFAMGLFLGVLTERARSIIPAMVCHAAINAFSFSMTVASIEMTTPTANVVTVVAGGIVMVACFEYVRRRPVRPTFSSADGPVSLPDR